MLLPGAPNALTARVIEEAGFEAVYVSGAGIANTHLAVPDIGLVTVSELVTQVDAMSEAVELPLVVDADTGFGNAVNVRRTVRDLERAGAAAIQLEDQVSPKRCGHFAGKAVIPVAEMVGKIRAAADARRDDDLVIVARTDAAATEGIEWACERARAYTEAGADVLFVEAPRTAADLRYVTEHVPGLHVANMVEGGLTPLQTRQELGELGFAVVLYANSAMRGAVTGMRRVLDHLLEHGDTTGVQHSLIDWQDRQHLVRKEEFDLLEKTYSTARPGS